MKVRIFFFFILLIFLQEVSAQGDGYLQKNEKRIFLIGSYYLPSNDGALKEMIEAGFNLFKCDSKEDLDRLQKFQTQGWIPLPLTEGVSENLKKIVSSVAGHSALAVWEGPDELVWNFTANSGLYRDMKIHKTTGAWWNLSPEAVKYAKEQSEVIMPKINDAIAYVRNVDPNNLQVWINEAGTSDMGYVTQYLDGIDITGSDMYPIKSSLAKGSTKGRLSMQHIGGEAKRWTVVSEGKPIWIVLQGFSWHELGTISERFKNRPIAYPSFAESRYMAYDVIVNGALGILYWDMRYLTSEEYRLSIYSLANEFSALQPFLTTDAKSISVTACQQMNNSEGLVVGSARQFGRDWMVALVNETDTTQMGVMVEGLHHLNGHKLVELYGEDDVVVRNGKFVTRMRPFEVKIFATSRKWEGTFKKGRNYSGL